LVYRVSGKWLTCPKRRFEIVAKTVADSLVTDELRVIEPENAAEVRRARGNNPDFIAWNTIGPEFSPYFGAYVALAQQGSLSGFPTPDIDPQWTQWYSKAAVIGEESVSVPAGTPVSGPLIASVLADHLAHRHLLFGIFVTAAGKRRG